MEKLDNQLCPGCNQKTCTLTEDEQDIPYFGRVYILGMNCSSCGFHRADVEPAEQHEPMKWTFTVEGEEDLKVRIVKSSSATVKIPYVVDITPGPDSEGYVTNVEGLIERVKERIQATLDDEEDKGSKKQAWKLVKKLNKVLFGSEKLKIIIEDPGGNSAIISDKAVKSKIK